MKKIIYLTHWRIPSEKTMSPLIMKTCQQFVRDGFDVELWIPTRHNPGLTHANPFEYHAIQTTFPVRRITTPDLMPYVGHIGFLLLVVFFNIAVTLRLLRYWHRSDVVIYAHDLRDLVLPALLGFPMFCEIHDFYESGVRTLNSFVLHRTRGLIVTNSIKQKHLHEKYGYPLEHMIRQPNAVQVSMFDIPVTKKEAREQLDLPQDTKLVIYTGHLFSWKGVDTLAEAAAYLPGDCVLYFVGGTEHDRKRLQDLIAHKNLPRIVFMPHQEHARMPIFLKAADVLVLPNTAKEAASKYETSPVKLFEYLASGHPIVVSDLPSIREIVSENEVFFAEPDNPRSFGEVITSVLEGDPKTEAKALRSMGLARQYSWESRGVAIKSLIERFS